jgi:aldehyde:ferredoxin oxidoreductase
MVDFDGRMLNVNLSDGTTIKNEVDKDIVRKFNGGNRPAAKLYTRS